MFNATSRKILCVRGTCTHEKLKLYTTTVPKNMKLSPKAAARKATFLRIAQIRAHREPSAFNPHYEPKPTPLRDSQLSGRDVGPRMCTVQVESTIRRREL